MRPPKKPNLFPQEPAYAALRKGNYIEYFQSLHADDTSWQRVRAGMAELARLTTEPRRVPVVVTVFPVRVRGRAGPYPFHSLHAQVAAEARLNGFEVFDLLPAYLAVESDLGAWLYADPLHPNLEGHHLAAVALMQFLCDSDRLPGEVIDFEQVHTGRAADADMASVLARSRR